MSEVRPQGSQGLAIASPGPERARVKGFEDHASVREALFDLVRRSTRRAIAEREHAGLISARGDAAATLFLDAARIRTLVDPASASMPGHEPVSVTDTDPGLLHRRKQAFIRRLEATAESGPMLALALARWGLSADAMVVLGAALAAELVPDLARLLAYLGGDASRSGVSVEAAAALLGPGVQHMLAVERMLAPVSRMHDAALVRLAPGDEPFARRRLTVPRQLLALLSGVHQPCDASVRVCTQVAPGPTHLASDDMLRLRAMAAHVGEPLVLGWLVGHRDADLASDIHRALAVDRWSVVCADLSLLARRDAANGLVRDAWLARAAVVLRTDIEAPLSFVERGLVASALDELAGRVPTYVVTEGLPEPRLDTRVGRLVVVARRSDANLRRAALDQALGPHLGARERERLAATLPGGPRRLARLAGPVMLYQSGEERASAAMIQAARQAGAPLVGPVRIGPPAQPWDDLAVTEEVVTSVRQVAERWMTRQRDRLVVLLQGRARAERLGVAARLAADLGLPYLVVDAVRTFARSTGQVDALLSRAIEAAASGYLVAVENLEGLTDARGAAGPELTHLVTRLFAATGLYALICPTAITPILDDLGDISVSVTFPDHWVRTQRWQRVLEERGLDIQDASALAAEFSFGPDIIAEVAQAAGPTLEDIWAVAAVYAT